jgi:hypothetical protein
MKQQRYSVDQVIAKLRRADVELGNPSQERPKPVTVVEFGKSAFPMLLEEAGERRRRDVLFVGDAAGRFAQFHSRQCRQAMEITIPQYRLSLAGTVQIEPCNQLGDRT